MVQGKLHGTNNLLELIEKINLRNNMKLLQAFRVLCHPPDECTISIIVDMEIPKPEKVEMDDRSLYLTELKSRDYMS